MPTQFDNQPIPQGTLEYQSNNSGGAWWLEDKDWYALEAAGWTVAWKKNDPYAMFVQPDGRFLGALATEASKQFSTPNQGVREWEKITGQDASDEGCNCCGEPHMFKWIAPDGSIQYANLQRGPATLSFS